MRKVSLLIVVLAMLALSVVPSFAQEEPGTIADIVVASTEAETPEFSILLAAVSAADPAFLELLSSSDAGVTVFAPTDAAFAAAFEALGVAPEDVLADPDLLNAVLAYHVVPAALTAESVVALDGGYVGTFLADAPLMISVGEDGSVMVNEATVVMADVLASNGVVHVIDSVLLPEMDEEAAEEEMAMEDMGTVADIVVASTEAETPEFTTLLAAVSAADPAILAGLSGGMEAGAQPITVFAPTDAAFASAFEQLGLNPADVLANPDLLNSVLLYHVLPGEFSAETLIELAGMSEEGAIIATVLPGTAVQVTTDGTAVMVNGVNVAMADVYADNGVIHAIDGVLLPPTE